MPRCPGAKMLAGANRAAAICADGTAEIRGGDAWNAGTYVLSTRARSNKATRSCAVASGIEEPKVKRPLEELVIE